MKKRTNEPAVTAGGAASQTSRAKPLAARAARKAKTKRGRKKEKTQISVRIDKAIMDLAYEHIGASRDRITDFIERGLILAMQEKFRLPPICNQVRFMATHAPREVNEIVDAAFVMTAWKDRNEWETAWRAMTLEGIQFWRRTLAEDPQWEVARAVYGYQTDPPPEEHAASTKKVA